MPLTVTPNTSTGSVLVDVTGLAEPVVVTRQTPNGPAVPVRGGDPFPTGVTSVVDRECPFTTPVVYTATYGAGLTTTASTTLTATQARLEHPGLSALGVWVRVVDDVPPVWESPSVVHPIINRVDPMLTAQPLRARNGTLRLAVDSVAGVNTILQLFASGLPALLRTPVPNLLRDGWIAAQSITDTHTGPKSTERILEVAYQVVGRPTGAAQGTNPWRWSEVVTAHGTWAEVRDAYPTWSGLVAGPVPA